MCHSLSPLWRINTGCGHSFHIECTLPTVSVCPVCHAILQKKMETLGKAANLAVFKATEKIRRDDDDSESDSDDNGAQNIQGDDVEDRDEAMTSDDDGRQQKGPDATVVFSLVGEIAGWQHACTPSQ